jgi:hypothetical protein
MYDFNPHGFDSTAKHDFVLLSKKGVNDPLTLGELLSLMLLLLLLLLLMMLLLLLLF